MRDTAPRTLAVRGAIGPLTVSIDVSPAEYAAVYAAATRAGQQYPPSNAVPSLDLVNFPLPALEGTGRSGASVARLKKRRQLVSVGAPTAAAKPVTKLPPPLILDEQGREVDAEGKPIERRPAEAPKAGADNEPARTRSAARRKSPPK